MKIIDMHCDTISRLYTAKKPMPDPFESGTACSSADFPDTLRRNHFHIDLQKLQKGDYLLQNFALFIDRKNTENILETALEMTDLYYQELDANRDIIRPVYSYEDIAKNRQLGKLSAMLTLEEGGMIHGSLALLRNFYRLGVRMITLTWNYENEIGAPNLTFTEDGMPLFSCRNEKGLTEFGIDMIQEMERLGIIIDVSHLSDGGFYDVARYTTVPFVASHSNCAAQCNVCRNLTDEMIRILGERGGLMGLNYCTDFLITPTMPAPHTQSATIFSRPEQTSLISDIVRHIRHIVNIGGIEVCALGSDFDGITNSLEFTDASGIQMLAEALLKNGFSVSDVEKICYRNVLRIYKDILHP